MIIAFWNRLCYPHRKLKENSYYELSVMIKLGWLQLLPVISIVHLTDFKMFLAFDQEEMTPHCRYSMTDH